MHRSRATVLLLLALAVPSAVTAQGSPKDMEPSEAGVRTAVEAYLRAHATGDASHIWPVFHPASYLFYVRDGAIATRSAEDYMAGFGGEPAEDEAERRRRIVMVDVTGNAAVAKVELDYPGALITDYFHLLREGEEWKIVNKIFHVAPR